MGRPDFFNAWSLEVPALSPGPVLRPEPSSVGEGPPRPKPGEKKPLCFPKQREPVPGKPRPRARG
eukprot:3994837-Pyramimonas_sp.AAC.1